MKTIKRLFLLCLFCLISISASAYDFSAKNADGVEIYYNITSSTDLTCEVTCKGDFYSFEMLYYGIVNIPASVTNEKDGKTYSVTSIGEHAFYYCTNLRSVTIPNSVTSIGNDAFYYCYGLTSIEIPNFVTSIGSGAFSRCSGLTSVTIPNSVTSIGNETFSYCYRLTSVMIGNSVTSIGEGAFEYCTGLTSVTIPNSVTWIKGSAFFLCTGLTSIEIPNSVMSIGYGAFSNCSGLTSVTIGNSVMSIGRAAFFNCSGLTSVTNLATTPQQIYSNVFEQYGTLHVIKGYKDVYTNADYWKNFTIVDDVDPTGIEEIKSQSTVNGQQSTDLYNLQGVKVSGQQNRGIVIKNGKKYVVK